MEEKNDSKQVLLSIIGIAVLVIAVVAVSFAFLLTCKILSLLALIVLLILSLPLQPFNLQYGFYTGAASCSLIFL